MAFLHQFLSALTLADCSLLFVSALCMCWVITKQDWRDFWPWKCCWVWNFQMRTGQRFKDLWLLPTGRSECKGGRRTKYRSDGFGECKNHQKEMFLRSCTHQHPGQEPSGHGRTPGCFWKAGGGGCHLLAPVGTNGRFVWPFFVAL